MNKILIATTNPAKKKELSAGLKKIEEKGIKLLYLDDFDIKDEPVENGSTFEENALLKAKFYADKTGLPTIADDGGLLIYALDGEPGVKSRRWPGYEATDEELIKLALQKLEGIKYNDRTARLQTCVCFYNPESDEHFCEEENIEGYIAEDRLEIESDGYPYRVLFIVKKYDKYYDEMTDEEHGKLNHRLIALGRILGKIKKSLLQ